MKRIIVIPVGVLAFSICIVSSALALKITVAEIARGAVQVQGNQANRNGTIRWQGVVVTTANKGGVFTFSTTIVPQDCVGELNDGVSTVAVVVSGCTPVSSGRGVLKTGQTTTFAAGDDGDFQAGVVVPSPRFDDNGDGTVTDNLTGLTWLKDAGCLGEQTWADAIAVANALADGNVACGLRDGSIAGDWRLPNRNELLSLIDLGTFNPSLPASHPFVNVLAPNYWSSTTLANLPLAAWVVSFNDGFSNGNFKTNSNFVTAVR
jgi:hypothetical protein